VWQAFYEKHRGKDFELLSIAVDMQGPDVVRPYTTQYGVTFPVAVDPADVFGQAFGLTAIPVTFLVDEVGIVRLQGGGPSKELLRQIEAVLKEPVVAVRGKSVALPSSRSRAELEARVAREPSDWEAHLALAQILDTEGKHTDAVGACQRAAQSNPNAAGIYFTWGLVLLHLNEKGAALAKLKQARDLAPGNWRIHKQIWALEHPEKFYSGQSPDYRWQKEELAREKRTRP